MVRAVGEGSVTVQELRGLWKASFNGKQVTYTEARFGPLAEPLAYRALRMMKEGKFDQERDDLLIRYSWKINDAAKQCGMSLGQMRQWILTGKVGEIEIKPPRRDMSGTDYIAGIELLLAQYRLAEASFLVLK